MKPILQVVERIGIPTRRAADAGQPTPAGLSPLTIAIVSGAGQAPMYLSPAEIAAVGGHQVTNPHTGQRVWQFGLWQEGGEWVYPPFRDPADVDGSRYRAGLAKLREEHRAYVKRMEGRPQASVRRFDDV
jgi:hypothetical protein